MTNEERKLERILSVADMLKEWAELAEKTAFDFKDLNKQVAASENTRAYCYSFVADWLRQIVRGE